MAKLVQEERAGVCDLHERYAAHTRHGEVFEET